MQATGNSLPADITVEEGVWTDPVSPISRGDEAALYRAVQQLENTSLAVRISRILGTQIGSIGRFIPARLSALAMKASGVALRSALRVALQSLNGDKQSANLKLHRAMAMASGAAGGALGFMSLPLELPVSTTVILRSIADIARSEGEDLQDPAVALACLQVFALGGGESDQTMDNGYFAVRGLLAKSISEAASYMAQKGLVDETAPVLLRLLSLISTRFGFVVSQKAAAQAAPVLGAFGGAAINLAFTQYYQSLAKGHFTVRRLERKYGPALVKREYERIAAVMGKSLHQG